MTAISEARHWDANELDAAYHAACIRDATDKALEHEAALRQCQVSGDKSIDAVSHIGPVLRTVVSLCNVIAPEVENE